MGFVESANERAVTGGRRKENELMKKKKTENKEIRWCGFSWQREGSSIAVLNWVGRNK